MASLKYYAAHDERNKPVYEARLPFHHGLYIYAGRRLRSALGVKAEDKQGRGVELLMNFYAGIGSKPAI
jgi:hypothetical protein